MTDNVFSLPTSRTCPRCGAVYRAHPALSRKDNVTPICPDCGVREALASIGVGADEQTRILEIIRRSGRTE